MKPKSIKSNVDLILYLIPILISLMMLTNTALAEGNSSSSSTIAVSCSIPAVPGINVPLIQEKTSNIIENIETTATTEEETKNPADETKNPSEPLPVIQTDTENKILLADGRNSSIVVQTLYSR